MTGPLCNIAVAAHESYLRLKVDADLARTPSSDCGFRLLSRSEWPQLAAITPGVLAPLFSELEPDLFAIHRTRRRARAKFDFHVAESGDVYFCESAGVTIFDKTGFHGPREHKRVQALHAPAVAELCLSVLSLSLGRRAYRCGYVALDIFRTVDDVVYGFHRDGEHFVGIYCVRRSCDGARTQLARDKAGADIVFDAVLQEGDLLFFDDAQVFHHTTPLLAGQDGAPTQRDAVIFTLSGIT